MHCCKIWYIVPSNSIFLLLNKTAEICHLTDKFPSLNFSFSLYIQNINFHVIQEYIHEIYLSRYFVSPYRYSKTYVYIVWTCKFISCISRFTLNIISPMNDYQYFHFWKVCIYSFIWNRHTTLFQTNQCKYRGWSTKYPFIGYNFPRHLINLHVMVYNSAM